MKIWSLTLINKEIMSVDNNISNIIITTDIPLKMGRSTKKKNDIVISQIHIAREHCEFFPTPDNLYIKSYSTAAPTYINNKEMKTDELTEIFAGQIISLGKTYNPAIYDLHNYSYLVSYQEIHLLVKTEIKEEIEEIPIITEELDIKSEPEKENFEVNSKIKQDESLDSNEYNFVPITSTSETYLAVETAPNFNTNIISSHELSQDISLPQNNETSMKIEVLQNSEDISEKSAKKLTLINSAIEENECISVEKSKEVDINSKFKKSDSKSRISDSKSSISDSKSSNSDSKSSESGSKSSKSGSKSSKSDSKNSKSDSKSSKSDSKSSKSGSKISKSDSKNSKSDSKSNKSDSKSSKSDSKNSKSGSKSSKSDLKNSKSDSKSSKSDSKNSKSDSKSSKSDLKNSKSDSKSSKSDSKNSKSDSKSSKSDSKSSNSNEKRKKSPSRDEKRNKKSKKEEHCDSKKEYKNTSKEKSKENSLHTSNKESTDESSHSSSQSHHTSRKTKDEIRDKTSSFKRKSSSKYDNSKNTNIEPSNNNKVFIQSNTESKLSLRVNVNKEISVPVTDTLKLDLRDTSFNNDNNQQDNDRQLFTPPHEIISRTRHHTGEEQSLNSDTESTSSNDFQSLNKVRKIQLIEPLFMPPRNRFSRKNTLQLEENKKSISYNEIDDSISPKDNNVNKVQINVTESSQISSPIIENENIILNNDISKEEEEEDKKVEASKIRPSGPIRRISRVPSAVSPHSMESLNLVPGTSSQEILAGGSNIKLCDNEDFMKTPKKVTVAAEEKERIILSMLYWNISWITEETNHLPPVWKKEHLHYTNNEYSKLKERENKKEGECINCFKRDPSEDNQILPKPLKRFDFLSYYSYIETMLPYILLHLWYILHRNYIYEKRNQLDGQVIGMKDEENCKRFLLVCLNVTTMNNSQSLAVNQCPSVEDFIILNFQNKSRNLENIKSQQYIGHVKNYLYLGSDLQKDANGQSFFIHKHKIDVLIKYPESEIELFQKVIINPIKQISEAVKKLGGLFHLSSSPLMHIILKPRKRYLYQPSLIHNFNLIETSLQAVLSLRDKLQNVLPISEEQMKIITPLTYTLCSKEPSLNIIEGLAGSGKTQTLAWLALGLLSDRMLKDPRLFHQRILIVTSSQTALDAFATKIHQVREKIIKGNINDFNMVVLGRAEGNLNNCVKQYTLEEQAKMQGDVSDRDKKYQEILNQAHLIIVSMDTITNTHFTEACAGKMKIPVCFVDDAQNIPEIYTLLPLVSGVSKLVLAGDITLTKPKIECKDAALLGLRSSLLSRVYKVLHQDIGKNIKSMKKNSSPHSHMTTKNLLGTTYYLLTRQRRMSPSIINMRNHTFAGYDIKYLLENKSNVLPFNPFAIFDCILPAVHQEYNIAQTKEIEQEWLRQEAKFAVHIVLGMEEKIKNSRSHSNTFVKTMVITPDTQHAQEVQRTLDRENKTKHDTSSHLQFCTKVRSIHHILSNEADIVVVCLGQSEKSPLVDPRFLHLAITRTKSTFIIIGNLNYFFKQCKIREWINLVNYSRKENSYFPINPRTKIQEIVNKVVNSNQMFMLNSQIMSPKSPPEDFGPELPSH